MRAIDPKKKDPRDPKSEKIRKRAVYLKNKDKYARAAAAKKIADLPSYRAKRNGYKKKYYAENDHYRRAAYRRRLRSKYGLTQQDFDLMLERQSFQCAICSNPLIPGRGTHVDHDHSTGKVRGLLCFSCNLRIGHLEKMGLDWLGIVVNYLWPDDDGQEWCSECFHSGHSAHECTENRTG